MIKKKSTKSATIPQGIFLDERKEKFFPYPSLKPLSPKASQVQD